MCKHFTIAVFVTAKAVNDLISVICNWLNQLWYDHTVEYYTTIKRNKTDFFVCKCGMISKTYSFFPSCIEIQLTNKIIRYLNCTV